MPFKSRKQERYLQINEPEIYRDWVEEYGHFKGAEAFSAECVLCTTPEGYWRGWPLCSSSGQSLCVSCCPCPDCHVKWSQLEIGEIQISPYGAESFSAEFAAEASYCSNFNDHQWIPFGSEEMSCDKCDAIVTPETIKLASEDMFADLDGITRDEKGMRHSPHKKCPDCGAKPTSSWIDPGKCECGRVMNPSEYTNIRFSAELKRDSCCCGATKSKPCACMIQGVMECNATCPCSLEKGAESFSADERKYQAVDVPLGMVCVLCENDKPATNRIVENGMPFFLCERHWFNYTMGAPNIDADLSADSFSAEEYEGCQHEWRTVRYGKHPTKRSQVWLCKGCNAEIDSITKPSQNRKIRPNSYTKNWRMPKQSHYFGAESFGAEKTVCDSCETDDYTLSVCDDCGADYCRKCAGGTSWPPHPFIEDCCIEDFKDASGAESFSAEESDDPLKYLKITGYYPKLGRRRTYYVYTGDRWNPIDYGQVYMKGKSSGEWSFYWSDDDYGIEGDVRKNKSYYTLSPLYINGHFMDNEGPTFQSTTQWGCVLEAIKYAYDFKPRVEGQKKKWWQFWKAESFGAEENEGELPENMNGCDLCGKSVLKRIKNKDGQVFYYCTNKEPTSFSEDGCMYNAYGSEIRSEGMWLIEDGKSEGYWYNGVVGNTNNPNNAYMKSPCPNCDNWHIVSDSCRNCLHCLNCCDCFQCDDCGNMFSEYEDNQSYAWCECEKQLCENCRKYDEITEKFYGKCCEGEKWDAESFGADSSETFVFNVADVSGESDDVFTYFIKADNEVEAEEKLHYEVSQDYPDMKFDFMLDGSFGAESFNSYKVAPDLSSYTKAELVSSIAGPQGTAAYQEVVYDPIAQSRMSAETATQRFKDYGNSLAGDSVCPACGSEDWDESFEDDEWRGYCGCGHEFSVDSAAANPLLTFYELEALKEQGTLTSDEKEYLEWTITSTLRELDSSSYTKQHIQDELVAHGWTLNRWGNAEPPKESASTLVVNAEGIDSFSPARLMVLGASIGVALGLYKTRGD